MDRSVETAIATLYWQLVLAGVVRGKTGGEILFG